MSVENGRSYQINVPKEHRTPRGLRHFPQDPGQIRNSYLFQVEKGIKIENIVYHVGKRIIELDGSGLDEGITFNEYVITAKSHSEFRSLVEGKWVRISGSVAPGGILNINMDSDGMLISYAGEELEEALEFSSRPA